MLAVSTIIPTYNRANLICRAVESAIAASSPDDEIIVIDDGSTDNTEKVVTVFQDRIRYIKTPNRGAGAARNRGVKEAKNPLVAFLDSDDTWIPKKLELHRTVMEDNPEIVFSFSDFAVRYVSGEERHFFIKNWHKDTRNWEEILGPGYLYSTIAHLPENWDDFQIFVGDLYFLEMAENYVLTSTLVVNRDAATDALWFAEDWPLYEDWECFGRLAAKGPCAYLQCETAWNHGHAGPRLTDAMPLVILQTRIALLERVWGSDNRFLANHAEQYNKIIGLEHIKVAKELFNLGKVQEARHELELAGRTPLSYKILSSLPYFLVRGAIKLRKSLFWGATQTDSF
jgi:glycosyltransferase involved in cell wall biosynthesis